MKTRFRLLGCALMLVGTMRAAAPSVAFVDVNVIPMDIERVLTHQTVVVTGDRIVQVGPTGRVKVPPEATRIDGAGKYLIPGLGEMHGHNPPLGSSREYIETIYFLFVANGVTTVRGMLGWPGQLELRDKVKSGEILGPSLYLAGPSFTGSGASAVLSPAAAEARVRQQKAEGWDLLKVHPGLKRDVYDAMAKTADEVGIRFAGHIPADVGLVHALERHQETVDHLDGYIEVLQADRGPVDRAKLAEIVKLTRSTHTAVVPTMPLWETIIGAADAAQLNAYPELNYLPRNVVDGWKASYERRTTAKNFDRARAMQIAANRKVVLKALNDGGVTILFGTDAPQEFSVPGFSIHREMQADVAAGMTPYEVLRSATKNVGENLGSRAKDRFGLVATGHRADLVLLEANPLTDIGHVAKRVGVMVRGRWLSEGEIQQRLAKIAAERK
ncbi:MAG: amidohydrolase family protein [Verrucomicrobia bacterium]|nr:amidohydrolase family protein [Verrucomicrobiota bacterium]